MHHARSILQQKYIETRCAGDEAGSATGIESAMQDAQYHKFFAAAIQKAIEKKRIPAGGGLRMRHTRPSATHQALLHECPWIQAQVDVYTLIAEEILVQQPTDDPFVIFDVGQACDRGTARVDGTVPTATTSSLWYCGTLQGFVSAAGMLACHGMDPSGLSFAGLEASERYAIVGNMMATSALALAVTPVLHALGFLTRDPKDMNKAPRP